MCGRGSEQELELHASSKARAPAFDNHDDRDAWACPAVRTIPCSAPFCSTYFTASCPFGTTFWLSCRVRCGIKRTMFFVYAALIGLVSGVTSGLFGVGGGVVMVPAMVFLLKLDVKAAIGTSLAVIIPTALVGTFKHHDLGHVNWRVALALVPTALAGGYLGSWLTKSIPAADLKRVFGGFLVLVGLRFLLGK